MQLAHIGGGSPQEELWAGLTHPILGWDHLAAMVAVGLLAGKLGGQAHWKIPGAFVASLLAGTAAGWLGFRSGATEVLAAISIGVLACCLLFPSGSFRWPRPLLVVAGFAYMHGLAHGSELPDLSVQWFVLGFTLTSAILHVLAIPIGLWSAENKRLTWFLFGVLGSVSFAATLAAV